MVKSYMFFYVEKTKSLGGTHLVHCAECPRLPGKEQRIFLGSFAGFARAVEHSVIHTGSSSPCLVCIKRT
jgi:hypothetical protein